MNNGGKDQIAISSRTPPSETAVLRMQQLLLINGNVKVPLRVDSTHSFSDGEFSVLLESGINLSTLHNTKMRNLRPLGFTLTETHGGRAVVQKVQINGLAAEIGLKPGDYIVGVGSTDHREWRFSVVLPTIQSWFESLQSLIVNSSRAAQAKKAKKKKESDQRFVLTKKETPQLSLLLNVWRPKWRPEAFILEAVEQQGRQLVEKDLAALNG